MEAVDLGSLFKIKIRHDNSLFNPAWYLDRVEILDGSDKYVFHCERWLAKNKDDGKIERSLYVKVSLVDLLAIRDLFDPQFLIFYHLFL